MTIGEKIKKARLEKGLTQAKLCGDRITRNMLSAIEGNKARPSYATAEYLAEQLQLPLSYLFSSDEGVFYYQKERMISDVRKALCEKNYSRCIELCSALSGCDDEIALILSTAHFELGKRLVLNGSLQSGKQHLSDFKKYCSMTVYDTSYFEHACLLYSALADNIKAPLLVMDNKAFEANLRTSFEGDLYKYMLLDQKYEYSDDRLTRHIAAKELIKERRYNEALAIMKKVEEERNRGGYNAYLIFGIYTDMEICYKQLGDFESAYRYASKRLSLIDGFKS